MCRQKKREKKTKTVFMNNCTAGHFGFCSAESIKHSSKGFNVNFFFPLPMLLIAKRSGMIVMLNKCVLNNNNNNNV